MEEWFIYDTAFDFIKISNKGEFFTISFISQIVSVTETNLLYFIILAVAFLTPVDKSSANYYNIIMAVWYNLRQLIVCWGGGLKILKYETVSAIL